MTQISPTSAEAEAEAEQARAGLSITLDRLRENLQPANVVEEVMSSAKLSASAMSDQLWDTARRNPFPALLIGTGLAMIFGFGARAVSKTQERVPDSLRSTSAGKPAAVESLEARRILQLSKPERPSDSPGFGAEQDILDTANRRLSGAASTIASAGRNAVSTIKPTGKPMSFSRSSDTLMSGISKVLDEQPLVLAAIGIAVGAALGAAIPQTETENNLMGESSHAVRDAAQGMVADQYELLKSTASTAVEDIKQSVADHGVTADNLSGLVGDVAEKAKAATYQAGSTFDPTKG